MQFLYSIPVWLIAVVFFMLLTSAIGGGIVLSRRFNKEPKDSPGGTFLSVLGASLGLLSLLLSFSYSMAGSRYDHRKQLLVEEVNAMGSSYLRASLLPDAGRSQMQELLRALVDVRLNHYERGLDPIQDDKAAVTSERLQQQIWAIVAAEGRHNPQSVSVAQVVQSVNDLIDAIAKRTSYSKNNVPETILLMLLAVGIVVAGLIGCAFGLSKQRNFAAPVAFAAIVSVVTLALLDLDRPRQGLIRVDQQLLIDLRNAIKPGDGLAFEAK